MNLRRNRIVFLLFAVYLYEETWIVLVVQKKSYTYSSLSYVGTKPRALYHNEVGGLEIHGSNAFHDNFGGLQDAR